MTKVEISSAGKGLRIGMALDPIHLRLDLAFCCSVVLLFVFNNKQEEQQKVSNVKLLCAKPLTAHHHPTASLMQSHETRHPPPRALLQFSVKSVRHTCHVRVPAQRSRLHRILRSCRSWVR